MLRTLAAVAMIALIAASTSEAGIKKLSKKVFPSWWLRAALCVHSYEGSWQDSGYPYFGGMQFDIPTWLSNGGGRYAYYPHMASPTNQLRVAYKLWQSRGWYPWPTTARKCNLI